MCLFTLARVGKENRFPSSLAAVFVCGCHQVKLSPLERTKERRCPRVPCWDTHTAPSAPLHGCFDCWFGSAVGADLVLFGSVAGWRKSLAHVLGLGRKILTSLAHFLAEGSVVV